MPHIVQVTPTSYSKDGVVGGGERIAIYIDNAIRLAAKTDGRDVTTTLLALDARAPLGSGRDHYQAIVGRAWDAHSLDADALVARLRSADVVYVHQCLTQVGLFVAAHARLLGKRVIGMDAGAGEALILSHAPDVAEIYDELHALSMFGASAYAPFSVPVHVIAGPVDTVLHRPPVDGAVERSSGHVLAVGRILPHKGFDRIIRALPNSMSLTVVGTHYDTSYLSHLRSLAAGKDVEFLDGLTDAEVRGLMHRAGVFVHASTHVDYIGRFVHKPELLGLAPLEALACGLPAIVSDAACLPELAVVPGCQVFHDEAELTAMLAAAALPSAAESAAMHDSVDARFGLQTVGRRLLQIMAVGEPCASLH